MVIMIVEGPDLSGKSFAIEKIGKHFNSGITIKNNYKPRQKTDSPKIYAQYWKIINLVDAYDEQQLIILDRFFPSQAVYSYMRGEDHMDYQEIIALDKWAKENDFIYIYIDTPLEVLEERYYERGDEHIKLTDLRKIKQRYDDFFESTTMMKIRIDTREQNWMHIFQKKLDEVTK